jgi:uncharacterized HAD superfamily protein
MSNTKKFVGKNRLIDIDGTICTDISNEESHLYPFAVAFAGAAERIKQWRDAGDRITFFTAREEKDRAITEKWLADNGFVYESLIMCKPRGGNYFWLDNLQGEYQQYFSWDNVKD